MHRFLIIASLSLLCSGCLFVQEQPEQFAAADDAWCQSRGARLGSEPYVECRAAINRQRQANQSARFVAIASQPALFSYDVPVPPQQPLTQAATPVVATAPMNCLNAPIGINSFSTSCF